MPTTHSELAILNAEMFDDGVVASKGSSRKTRQSSHNSSEDGTGPRKRTKTQAEPAPAPTGEKSASDGAKKSRGRPRLNANDATAVERRRTQIRLAQRAYRNRKENAITTLEQQVKDLRDTNEEMSNAFMALHDFAVRRGLLDKSPDFGSQLRSTTEKFLSLARRSAETGGLPGDDDSPPESQQRQQLSEADAEVGKGSVGYDNDKSSSPDTVVAAGSLDQNAPPSQQLLGGLFVTHETVSPPDLLSSMSSTFPPFPDTRLSIASSSEISTTNAPTDFEIITQPTLENASFPFPFTDAHIQSYLNPSPYPYANSLPSPRSFAAAETTFGRRLHRVALERALYLIELPNPPPLRLVRVFGFCLPFETADNIKHRLRVALDRSRREALSFWQYPFHHPGGAGTHFLATSPGDGSGSSDDGGFGLGIGVVGGDAGSGGASRHQQQHLMGSQGTVDVMRTRHGPFSRAVEETRETRMDRRQRITVPGFEGDFYDPDEVELYLHRLGVDIMPGQDYVAVEVDLSVFADPNPATTPATTTATASSSSPGAEMGGGGGVEHLHFPAVAPGLFPSPAFMGMDGNGGVSAAAPTGSSLTGSTGGQPISPLSPPQAAESAPDPLWGAGLLSGGGGDLSNYFVSGEGANPMGPPGPDFGAAGAGLLGFTGLPLQQPPQSQKTLGTLNVESFVNKLVDQATCLGRSPGFRIDNVRKAFLESTQF